MGGCPAPGPRLLSPPVGLCGSPPPRPGPHGSVSTAEAACKKGDKAEIPLSAPLPRRATLEDGFSLCSILSWSPGPLPKWSLHRKPAQAPRASNPGPSGEEMSSSTTAPGWKTSLASPTGPAPSPGALERAAWVPGDPCPARVSWARRVAGSPVLETRAQTPSNSTAPPRPGPARQRPPQGRLGWAEAERKGRGRWGRQSQAVRGAGCHVPSHPQRLVAAAQKRWGVGKP